MRRVVVAAFWVVALAGCEGGSDAPDDPAPAAPAWSAAPASPTGAVTARQPAAPAVVARAPAPSAPDPEPPGPDPDPPPACPAGVVCFDTFPFAHTATTAGAPTDAFDAYACAPDTDESGPEVVYRLEVAEAGLLALQLVDLPAGVDVDVHLLSALDPAACLDRGHWRAAAWVQPGVYWVVADTWVDDAGVALAGDFTLTAALTTPAALADLGLDPAVAEQGLRAFATAWTREETDRLVYALTDFSLHSAQRRQWIVDLATGDLLWHLHVAHGRGFEDAATVPLPPGFSNVPETHLSSVGLLRTAEPYVGDYGVSFRLDGLEPGFNDNVRRRDIVMHPWEGSRPEYVAEHGYTQPTWGCPGIDDRVAAEVVERLAGGALMFFWYPDHDWLAGSTYLSSPGR
ncbi:MAG: murein L,D-transpeptidase catalytic domain family protein [Myxococcales bacterium]|nr:murein L,D-transpeptidase catalytic domain family protein [Myxococcales bacterium]